MRSIVTVFWKEVTDNFRDRRTMLSALVFGPLLGPLVFSGMISLMLSNQLDDVDEVLEFPVIGAEFAPNLMQFMRQNNVSLKELPASTDGEALVRNREYPVVLMISETYPDHFVQGVPATVTTVADQSSQKTQKPYTRLQALLEGYSRKTSVLRLQARGISSVVVQPLNIDNVDVSTPASRAIMIVGVITYFFIFAVLMGGMYLAIDTTAGERERGSLESLLSVPVSRARMILGKMLATGVFMAMSLLMSIVAFYFSVRFLPLEKINMVANFSVLIAFKTFLIMLPFVAFGAAFMTIIATYSKTYKEAQSYLSMAMMLPTLPIMLAIFSSLKPQASLMMVPSLSQHLLVTEMVKGIPLEPQAVVISVISTLALALVLMGLSVYRYYQESLLV
ncbi:MAG: ABC transporter permease [Gammaproteobacteria bacterium]